jgi:hypothetical protein
MGRLNLGWSFCTRFGLSVLRKEIQKTIPESSNQAKRAELLVRMHENQRLQAKQKLQAVVHQLKRCHSVLT